MRIRLPKRWSRAKRKRERVKVRLALWREEVRKTLYACIDRIWSDAMNRPYWPSVLWNVLTPNEFIDDAEFLR